MTTPVNLLAFDTSTHACTIGLQVGDHHHINHQIAPRQQAQLLLPTIDALLRAAATTLKELSAIVVGCGPGSFTGVRLACSAAQGLAYGANLPVISLSSLAILAQTAAQQMQASYFLVAIDARAQQIYFAMYRVHAAGIVRLIGEEQLAKPDEIKLPHDWDQLRSQAWVGLGDAWKIYEQDLAQRLNGMPKNIQTEILPHAEAMLTLARIKFAQNEMVSAREIMPIYLK